MQLENQPSFLDFKIYWFKMLQEKPSSWENLGHVIKGLVCTIDRIINGLEMFSASSCYTFAGLNAL